MNEVELKKLWDRLRKNYNVESTSYDEFKKLMISVEYRKKFFNKYTAKGFDLGDYNTYEKSFSIPTMSDFIGTYTTKIPSIKKIRVYKGNDENKEDSLFLSSNGLEKIPQLKDYTVSKLTPNKDNPNVFSISNKSGDEMVDVITFANNGFTFAYSVYGRTFTIKATKEAAADSNNVTPPTPVKTDSNTNSTVDTDVKKPTPKTRTITFEKTPEDKTPRKKCSDFPFELGCVNSKIGDFNAAVFRGERYNDTYTTRVQSFLDNHSWFTSENINKKLTLDIWNEFMNISVIKESVKKVLKEYINKKK